MTCLRLVISLALVLVASGRGHAEPTRDYVVRAHETCLEIAVRELGDGKLLPDLHRLNPQLGPLPHHLKQGQIIKLPVGAAADPDAHLTDQRGDVEVRRAGEAEWLRRETGAGLFRAWRVGARARATAQVTFRDTSSIAMRENSVVVIFGSTSKDASVGTFKATLETGALRTRLGAKRMVLVETTAGEVRLEQGRAVLSADPRATRVSNHSGAAVTLRGANPKKAVSIGAGFGSTVAARKDPTPPRPLPPAPQWTDTAALLAVGWSGRGGRLQATWQGSAARYHIELARDPDLTMVDVALEVGGNVTTLDAQQLPVGEYYLAVSAIDEAGLESAPSVLRAVRVIELPLPAAALATDDGVRVGLGTTFELPPNVRCSTSSAPATSRVEFDTAGEVALRCEGSNAPLVIQVAAVTMKAGPVTLRAGATTELAIELASEIAPGPLSAVASSDAIDVQLVNGRATIHGRTAGLHRIQVRAGTNVVGYVDVTVLAAELGALAASTASPRTRPWLEAGAFVGATVLRPKAVADLGVTVALRPRDDYSVEVSAWRELDDRRDTTISVGLMITPMEHRFRGRLRPRLRVGLIGRDRDERTGIGGFAGIDALLELVPHVALVVGVDSMIVAEDLDLVGFTGVRFGL